MSCTNCFNGCSEIVSDKCVKYTGVDIPALGIQTGDTLEFVEQTLASFLITALDGTGIKPEISFETACTLVTKYLPECSVCGIPTLNDILQALISAACDLQEQITNVVTSIDILEAPYTTGCVTVPETTLSNTHNVLQAVITNLCALNVSVEALQDLQVTNVDESNVNDYIAAYIASINLLDKYYTRMVPYSILPWYGDISGKFSLGGAGYGAWENIYLCNGLNSTPDMRGRVPVGLTNGLMGGDPMDPQVDPVNPKNPNYFLGNKTGVNYVALTTPQIPIHTHANTAISTDAGHTHTIPANMYYNGLVPTPLGFQLNNQAYIATVSQTSGVGNAIITTTMTNATAGGGETHTNTQPSIGTFYIMYIPVP